MVLPRMILLDFENDVTFKGVLHNHNQLIDYFIYFLLMFEPAILLTNTRLIINLGLFDFISRRCHP